MKNLHKSYYKDYFNGADFSPLLEDKSAKMSNVKSKNDSFCSRGLLFQLDKNPCVNATTELKIQYPGLVTGIGITHEAKIEGEFKLGVHFDWTYGMPVIYGSSVKGVLRSAFKDGYVDAGMIAKVNKENPSINIPEWVGKPENRGDIIDEIFEGGKKSIYERDIFFDAVIKHADPKGRILCSDSITPHGENPLKNPIPITFMKIAPGCTLEFRFKLVTSNIDGKEFNAEQKKALFKEILKTVGVGAKTNVGYGQLE